LLFLHRRDVAVSLGNSGSGAPGRADRDAGLALGAGQQRW
jgi:hypothetical protein